MLSHRLTGAAAALFTALSVSEGLATEYEPEPEPRNGFSAKVQLGGAYHHLYGHSIAGGVGGVALGVQFKDIGALHGHAIGQIGMTDSGLQTTMISFGPTWEFELGRVRPGLGPVIHYLVVDRATGGTLSTDIEAGARVFVDFDLWQSRHTAIHLTLLGELTHVPDSTMGSFGLMFGARFKAP